mgnify:CR=1 FL=1
MSIGLTQIVVVLVIVLLLFGSKRIRSLGSDLGKAFTGFKKEIKNNDPDRDSWVINTNTRYFFRF